MESKKITRFFSEPLMKQNIKSNYILIIAITLIMCLICVVSTYAISLMPDRNNSEKVADAQEDFYTYLYVFVSYNEMAGTELSYEDFASSEDKTVYDTVFEMMNQQSDTDLSSEGFQEAIDALEESDVSMETYVKEFEYVYALNVVPGCFSGEELSLEDMMSTIFEAMGMDSDMMSTLEDMDTTAMFNEMYYSIMGLLPIFIYIVIVGNSLVVDQVDKGSMAYVLSTPTKRNAVTITQALFMILSPAVIIGVTLIARLIACEVFMDTYNTEQLLVLHLGMYILVEAVAGICYFGSCFFDRSRYAMGFGGGLTVWFFIASLLGLFGNEDMVSMGFGAEQLGVFNNLTLVGLYDVDAIFTIGTGSVDEAFIWKLAILAGIAVVFYAAGALRFRKKDLPL